MKPATGKDSTHGFGSCGCYPMSLNEWQIRNRIIKRLHKMRDDLEQTIRDIEWWNKNRTDAEPFDLGFERVMVNCVRGQIDAWENDDMEAVNRWQSRMNALVDSCG